MQVQVDGATRLLRRAKIDGSARSFGSDEAGSSALIGIWDHRWPIDFSAIRLPASTGATCSGF